MTDYLALARDHAQAAEDGVFGAPSVRAHLSAVTAFASLAIAEALTLPQGTVDTGQTTGSVAPASSPAEPSDDDDEPVGEVPPSLVTLDRTEQGTEALGELARWRAADRLFPCETTEWWDATLRLRDVADRIGGAL